MFKGSNVALITPFKDNVLDIDSYIKLINFHIENGTSGLVPAGTTGESPTLNHDEHEKVIEICIKEAGGKIPVIAGTGSNSTEEAISLTKHAEKAGASGVLVVTPYYNKPTQEGLYQHYKSINDNTSLPIIIYNIPSRCVIDMSVETMARLFELKNIAGVKDATGDLNRLDQTLEKLGPEFIQLTGEDGLAFEFNKRGGVGIISVTANIAPKLCSDMQRLSKSKSRLIGPNCPGIITPGEAKVGIMPGFVFKKGNVGLVSKSGTLTYEAADQITKSGFGISTAIGIGGDPIIGTTVEEAVEMFFNSIFLSIDAKVNDEDIFNQIPDKSDSIETLSQATVFIGADEKVTNLNEIIKINARKKRKNHLVIKFILLERIRYKQILKEKQNPNHA